MRKQVFNAYCCTVFTFAMPVFELWQVIADGVGQAQQPSLHQQHGRNGRCHGLGARCHVEHRLGGHGLCVGIGLTIAIGFKVGQFAVAHHSQHRPRRFFVADGAQYNLVGSAQTRQTHAHFFGRSRGNVVGPDVKGKGTKCQEQNPKHRLSLF